MADAADKPTREVHSKDEMHWGISYLREDIQDLRTLLTRMEEKSDAKFAEVYRVLRASIAALDAKFDERFNRQDAKFESRFDRHEAHFHERFNQQDAKSEDRCKRSDERFDQQDAKLEARFDQQDARFDRQDARFDRHDSQFEEIHRLFRQQSRELTQRMLMIAGLTTTVILAAIKL